MSLAGLINLHVKGQGAIIFSSFGRVEDHRWRQHCASFLNTEPSAIVSNLSSELIKRFPLLQSLSAVQEAPLETGEGIFQQYCPAPFVSMSLPYAVTV
jgi:hypothetical protein